MRSLRTLAPVALTAVALLLPRPALADCIDPRECFCAANAPASTGALYRVEVVGSDATGTQLQVVETFESSPEPDLDIIAEYPLGYAVGTELLYRDGAGHLVIESSSSVTCSASWGAGLSVTLDDAILLSTVSDCTAELVHVTVRGTPPPCNDTTDVVTCQVAPHARAPWTALLFAGVAVIGRRRRR